MVKHYTRTALIKAVQNIIAGGPYKCIYQGDGRAGHLMEDLLGISNNNYDVADAVGFEIKTSRNPNTPITLFHKDPMPRNTKFVQGAVNKLVQDYGWLSQHHGQEVKSFRATIYGTWSDQTGHIHLRVVADEEKIHILCENQEQAYWDSNALIGAASAKLRNMIYVKASIQPNGYVSYTEAQIFETFSPFKFLQAINKGIVAIDFDARSNPGKNSIRNHGTKFRIKEKDIPLIYQKIIPINATNQL